MTKRKTFLKEGPMILHVRTNSNEAGASRREASAYEEVVNDTTAIYSRTVFEHFATPGNVRGPGLSLLNGQVFFQNLFLGTAGLPFQSAPLVFFVMLDVVQLYRLPLILSDLAGDSSIDTAARSQSRSDISDFRLLASRLTGRR
jgi:hypothetical protein